MELELIRVVSVLAALAVSVQLVILCVLHALPTGYDPIHDAISDYGVGKYRSLFWAQLVAGATACAAIALALTQLHPYVPKLVVVLLFANALARLLMPAFPTDQSGNRFETVKGTVHMVLAFVAFAAVAAAATGLGGLFTHYPEWSGVKGHLETLGWIVMGGAIATALALIGPRLKRIFGLIERIFTVSVIAWLFAISTELIRFGK
jgi:hypothetical membrane protein